VTALHQRIAADLRAAIHQGTYQAGQRLPTEAELMTKYGSSRSPVRQALGTLMNEGLIETATSRGTFVREHRPLTLNATRFERDHREVRALDAFDAYRAELATQGLKAGQTFEMKIIPASADVAARLGVAEGSLVVCRRCVRSVDGQPSSVQDSYYPMDIAEGTEIVSSKDVPRGIIRVLAERGHVEVGYIDEVIPRMPPTPEEIQLLRLGPGVPVLDQIRTAYTEVRPVRLTWNIWAGSQIHLLYEIGDLQATTRDTDVHD
jgi:GntR family transcriptional regulator